MIIGMFVPHAWPPGRRALDREEPTAEFKQDAGPIRAPGAGRRRGMSEQTKAVTDESFRQDVLEAPGPVLVDFWAEWCGPCKAVGPVLDELARDYAGKLTVAKVDIDENPVTPNEYGVRGIPTMLLFRDGKLLDQKVGALPKSALKDWIAGQLEGEE
jgi:thioredoxin 1